MKAILITAVIALLLSPFAFSQATPPPATPAPVFDALHIAPAHSTPAPLTAAQQLAQKQALYKTKVKTLSSQTFTQLAAGYAQLLALTQSDDSAKGGLTPAQKAAALSTAEKTELLTNAWLVANLLNGIAPGTVPNPPAQ